MPQLIPANVLVGDRSYRLKIETEEEEMVRKTIKTINEKIIEFKTHFAGKDMQDYIAMVLLWFATEQNKNTFESTSQNNLSEKILQIEQLLDKTLES
jgi:cell division protein ZapA